VFLHETKNREIFMILSGLRAAAAASEVNNICNILRIDVKDQVFYPYPRPMISDLSDEKHNAIEGTISLAMEQVRLPFSTRRDAVEGHYWPAARTSSRESAPRVCSVRREKKSVAARK